MRAKKWIPAILVAVVLCQAAAFSAPVRRVRWIQAPLFSGPAIVVAGTSFRLEFKPEDGLTLKKVSLQAIGNPAIDIPCAFKPAGEANGIFSYDVTVPKSVQVNLYNLAAQLSNDKFDYQPHSVKVIKAFKKDFDFVQLTDIHFNVQEEMPQDRNRIRRRLLQDITKLNPEFVLFTGDLGLYPESYDIDYVYGYEEMSQWLRAPIFMVPGNHEQYIAKINNEVVNGRKYWEANYGSTYRSFDYDGMHFIGMNDFDWPEDWREHKAQKVMMSGALINAVIGPEQWGWVKSDLKKSMSEGKTCVAFAHIPINTLQGGRRIGFPPNQYLVSGPSPKEFVGELESNGCSYIFIGHMHYNVVNKYQTLSEVLTLSAGIGPGTKEGKWGYRIVHVKNGKIAGWTIHEVGFSDLTKLPAKK